MRIKIRVPFSNKITFSDVVSAAQQQGIPILRQEPIRRHFTVDASLTRLKGQPWADWERDKTIVIEPPADSKDARREPLAATA